MREARIRPRQLLIAGLLLTTLACGEQAAPATTDAPAISEQPATTATKPSAPATEGAAATRERLLALPEAKRPALPADAALRSITEADSALTLPVPGVEHDGETHMRHPWKLPDGATGVVVEARWKDLSWGEVEWAVGTGICPHRGQKLTETTSADGLAVVHYQIDPGNPPDGTNWFLHVNADTVLKTKPGETFEYQYAIFSY